MEILNVNELVLHPLAKSTPRMSEEQYAALKASIDSIGQQDPILVYRMKIIDGRHRWLILQELGIKTIKVDKLPNNTTMDELNAIVTAKEVRRHETASQLAIRAYRLSLQDGYTQLSAASALGANRKRVGEAKKIIETYGRGDIVELIHQGKKFNTGTDKVPFWTDSLGTILRWLAEHSRIDTEQDTKVKPREELTESEIALVNAYFNTLRKESTLVQSELVDMLYASIKESDNS